MAIVTEIPTNYSIYTNAGTVNAGQANTFRAAMNGYAGTVEDKAQSIQAWAEQFHAWLGFGAIGGGSITAVPSSLNVTITAATAIVGNYVRSDSTGTVGLTNSATNYIYFRQDSSWSTNTAGTVPGTADGKGTAFLWGSAITAGGSVSSVSNVRADLGSVVRTTIGANGYDIAWFVAGTPTASQVCLDFCAPRPVTIPASLTSSVGRAGSASTGTVHFPIAWNGTAVGSVTFAASGTATFSLASAINMVAGDTLRVTAPGTADATLQAIKCTLVGSY